jgi:hypothetical protein
LADLCGSKMVGTALPSLALLLHPFVMDTDALTLRSRIFS